MARSRYKSIQRKSTVGAAVPDAFEALDNLKDEMEEWASNMESSSLAHTDKCSEVRACADQLGSITSVDDIPEDISNIEFEYVESYAKRHVSRAVRRDNAVNMLNAAMEAIKNFPLDTDAESSADKDLVEQRDQIVEDIEQAVSEAEGAEFPGMY